MLWEVNRVRSLISTLVALAILVPCTAHAADDTTVEACLSASEKGQRARASGKLREARDHFAVCGGSGCPAIVRRDCAQWQSELESSMPTIVLVPVYEGLRVVSQEQRVDSIKVTGGELVAVVTPSGNRRDTLWTRPPVIASTKNSSRLSGTYSPNGTRCILR